MEAFRVLLPTAENLARVLMEGVYLLLLRALPTASNNGGIEVEVAETASSRVVCHAYLWGLKGSLEGKCGAS